VIQGRLTSAIHERGVAARTVFAFPELRCVFAGRVIVPDITVLKWERIPTDDQGDIEAEFMSYPDWIIEILSPEQSTTKVIKKILLGLEEGTELGWLIDPEEQEIFVFQPGLPTKAYEGSDPLPMLNILKDWQLTVADIFGWLSFKNKASNEV
jgi:Uma2 family endonuclease